MILFKFLSTYLSFAEHVRVVNGSNRCSGRVEVYNDSNWKRVCSSDWAMADAEVVCREINCGNPTFQTEVLHFGEARNVGGIKPNCVGNESSISQCTLQDSKESCVDATILCTSKSPMCSDYISNFVLNFTWSYLLFWMVSELTWLFFFLFHLNWQTVNQFGWWTGLIGALVEWKSTTMDSGERSVMTDGGCRKQLLYVERWTVGMLSRSSTSPTSAEVGIRFGWTTLSVLVMRRPSVTARTEVLDNTTVTTMKMLVLYAQVTHAVLFLSQSTIGNPRGIHRCAFVCNSDV